MSPDALTCLLLRSKVGLPLGLQVAVSSSSSTPPRPRIFTGEKQAIPGKSKVHFFGRSGPGADHGHLPGFSRRSLGGKGADRGVLGCPPQTRRSGCELIRACGGSMWLLVWQTAVSTGPLLSACLQREREEGSVIPGVSSSEDTWMGPLGSGTLRHPQPLEVSSALTVPPGHWVVSDSFSTPWTVGRQAPLSVGFSRKEYWSGLRFPSSGCLPDPGIEPRSPTLQADSLPAEKGSPRILERVAYPFSRGSSGPRDRT